MAPRTASQIKFGVEIECYLPSGVEVEVGGYHHGLQINWAPAGWNGQQDGSLHAPAGYKAVEIVSPALAGEDGLIEVYYMADSIKQLGGIVDGSCGLHVHVDANTLTDEQVKAIRAEFIRFEKTFYSLSGERSRSRYNHNCYCKPSSMCPNIMDRYQGINLLNYLDPSPLRRRQNRRTVEIRCFAGTLEVAEIIAAVYMAVGLVAKVEAGWTGGMMADTPVMFGRLWANDWARIVPEEDASQLVEHLYQQYELARL
jgi:hypothetical protein